MGVRLWLIGRGAGIFSFAGSKNPVVRQQAREAIKAGLRPYSENPLIQAKFDAELDAQTRRAVLTEIVQEESPLSSFVMERISPVEIIRHPRSVELIRIDAIRKAVKEGSDLAPVRDLALGLLTDKYWREIGNSVNRGMDVMDNIALLQKVGLADTAVVELLNQGLERANSLILVKDLAEALLAIEKPAPESDRGKTLRAYSLVHRLNGLLCYIRASETDYGRSTGNAPQDVRALKDELAGAGRCSLPALHKILACQFDPALYDVRSRSDDIRANYHRLISRIAREAIAG